MNSVILFYSPVQHMGKDGYSTRKYFPCLPWLSFFVGQFSILICFPFSHVSEQTSVIASAHVLCSPSDFSSNACLYMRDALIYVLPLGSLCNSPESRADAQQTDVLMSQHFHEPYENTLGSSAVHHHTLYDHTTSGSVRNADQIQMPSQSLSLTLMHACSFTHL